MRPRPLVVADRERELREKIHFLLPPEIAIFLMVGMGALAVDLVAVHQLGGLLMMLALEIPLIMNIVARRGLQRTLSRLLTDRCLKCGYDLCATPDRCRECGTPRILK